MLALQHIKKKNPKRCGSYKELQRIINYRGLKALLQQANFTMGSDATLNTEIHKNSVRIKAPNAVSA